MGGAMMLRQMIGIETEPVVGLRQREAVRVLPGDIGAVLVKMIKDAAGQV
ncbi:hypothetical protein ACVWXO_000636 [Bradyrhizobium sp. LM2.7]